MREIPRLCRFAALCFALLFITAGYPHLTAQTASSVPAAKSAAPEELSQAELTEAYRNVREQLRATQTAIVNNRFEAEATARTQAAVIAEKIVAMNALLLSERKVRQSESDRLEFEREQHQAEIQRSNRSVVWVACIFGSAGLLAMVFAALFQWRAINRIAEAVDRNPQLPAPGDYALLGNSTGIPTGQALALSTQRLMSTIDRMENRIKELEHTSAQPLPAESTAQSAKTASPGRTHQAIA